MVQLLNTGQPAGVRFLLDFVGVMPTEPATWGPRKAGAVPWGRVHPCAHASVGQAVGTHSHTQ